MVNPESLSLRELNALIAEQKSRLGKLKQQRKSLKQELTQVNAEIAGLEGKGRGRAAGGRTKRSRGRRATNKKPLKDVLTELLSSHKKGLSLQALHDKVLESGYKTTSRDFKNVLYQYLYQNSKRFVRDTKKRVYKLK